MLSVRYLDDFYVEQSFEVSTAEEVDDLVARILRTPTKIGYPTLTFVQPDETELTLATDGSNALLVYFQGDGTSLSSIGDSPDAPVFVFDYEGHWSEAGGENAVPLSAAVATVKAFVVSGSVSQGPVKFEQD